MGVKHDNSEKDICVLKSKFIIVSITVLYGVIKTSKHLESCIYRKIDICLCQKLIRH